MPEPRPEPPTRNAAPAPKEEPCALADWRRRWREDRRDGLPRHPGWLGRLKLALKRLVRRTTLGSQLDLWERQRLYNLEILERLEAIAPLEASAALGAERTLVLEAELARLGLDLQQVQSDLVRDLKKTRESQQRELQAAQAGVMEEMQQLADGHFGYLESHDERLKVLEALRDEAFQDLRRHLDALYARLDQKMEDYRRRSRHLWSQVGALLAAGGGGDGPAVARTASELDYLELEDLFRGVEADIERRIEPYVGLLEGRGTVLDLGCGRGEALEVLGRRGIPCRGVDGNAEMVAVCRGKGLEVSEGDLFEALASLPEGELGGIVSFHVIEHLPPGSLNRLARLAWRGLSEGGVLALETPNPLSLVVAARNFWIDPTHLRPVHPATLKLSFELAGFESIQRLDLQPFAPDERLPELVGDELPAELGPFVDRLNRLRDELDRLLFGYQDYGMVGIKPAAGGRAAAGRE